MTFEVHTSQFWDGADQEAFVNAVQNHINTMHAFNMLVDSPRPIAHPLVERAISRIQRQGQPDQYVADFVVIDDTTPPPLSLEDKKDKLTLQLRTAEADAANKIISPRKSRLVHLNGTAALAIDADKRTDAQKEDIALLDEIQALQIKNAKTAAQAESEIEDLTEQTIDSWQLPTFG